MPTPLPKFLRPPVVETILSAQFVPIQGFTSAHSALFWEDQLSGKPLWSSPTFAEQFKVDDVFEEFGERVTFAAPGIRMEQAQSSRLQIIRQDQTRMIQIQDTRFIYNWRRQEGGEYPSYEIIRPEFDELFDAFRQYASSRSLPAILPNQWEVTYINHIPKGTLWKDVTDWRQIVSILSFPSLWGGESAGRPDTTSASWRFRLADDAGRLQVQLQHALARSGDEVLSLQLTARGPVQESLGKMLGDGLRTGHDHIVGTFKQMTSDAAHAYWGIQ